MKKLTTDEFIEKAKIIHNDFYDYSLVKYNKAIENIIIICKTHGEFFQIPNNHLRGQGCPICAQNKRKDTLLKIYGVDNPGKSELVQEKMRQTNLKKYGVEYNLKSNENKRKSKETSLKKYGTEYPNQSYIVKEKIKSTLFNNFGENPYAKDGLIKSKTRATLLEKYGVEHQSHIEIPKERLEKLVDIDWLTEQHINQEKSLAEISKELNLSASTVGRYFKYTEIPVKSFQRSIGEKELIKFVAELTEIKENCRSIIYPKELDIFIPEKNLAIEYNGCWWHSSFYRNNVYHLDKYINCQKKGIKLLQFWDFEWETKKDICKSIIKTNLGKSFIKYARKGIVKECSIDETRKFLNENHIQGYCQAKIRLGLFINDELMSIMTLGKPRFSKKYNFELIRFCNKINHSIVGAASKLFSYFLKHYSGSVISYCDKRLFNGDLYEKLNFIRLNSTKPNYFYIKGSTIIPRYQAQKHKLNNLLNNFNENNTETENMLNNGYHKVFDCGNDVWVFNN